MRPRDIWSLRHATRTGFIAGLAALLLWPVYSVSQGPVWPLFVAALAVTAFSGISILFITAVDLATVSRGRSILPARIFDLALGALLTLPAGTALVSLIQ